MPSTREVILARRPAGRPVPADFALVERALPDPDDGEVVVRNVVMSVDAAMRLRMGGEDSYLPAFALGAPLGGRAVGVVEASRSPAFLPGDLVASMRGWRERHVTPAGELERLPESDAPLSAHLGVLGTTGLAAYVGLFDVGRIEPGETVLVSAAAGAVGSLAGQLARLHGCRTVGMARGSARVAELTRTLGFDAAVDQEGPELAARLRDACPGGVDVFFDNVGGPALEAALEVMAVHGRVVACGMISGYDDERPAPGPRNLMRIVTSRLTVQGFLAYDHRDRMPAVLGTVGEHLAAGRLVAPEHVVEGLERAPEAFLALVGSGHVGKVVVRLGPDPAELRTDGSSRQAP